MPLTATLITDLAALAQLLPAWQALTDRLDGSVDFFASPAYTHAYLAYYQPSDWFVVAIYDASRPQPLRAVFPLQRFNLTHESHRFSACKALGLPYVHYIDFALSSADRRELITFLLNDVLRQHQRIDLVFFWPLHEDSKLYLTLQEDLGRSPALKADRYPNNLHHIDTRGQRWADYTRSRPGHTFKDAAYCLRRLGKKGRVSWTQHTDPQSFDPALRQLCHWNHARFGSQHAYAHFADWPEFLAQLANELAALGRAELTTLELDGQAIAAALCFLHKGRRYFYLTDYDPRHQADSPNKMLLSHLAAKTFEERGVFCLGAGNYAYKRDWVHTVGEVKSAIVFLNPEARPVLEPHLDKAGISRVCGF